MKKTFVAIQHGDLESVKAILAARPGEINAVAKQPPKKDDGQSLLQVALKTGNLEIANLLLDHGADVNFMESEDCCNDWRAPVLHDAIRCAMMNARWNTRNFGDQGYKTHSTQERADAAFAVLKRMLDMGADVYCADSYGNTSLDRAILDANQLLPAYNHATGEISDNRIITDELRHDFTRIFNLLFEHGASNQWLDRHSGRTLLTHYAGRPVAEFLDPQSSQKSRRSLLDRLFRR